MTEPKNPTTLRGDLFPDLLTGWVGLLRLPVTIEQRRADAREGETT